MNYERIYTAFIADRRTKEADLIASGTYFERHHIRPRSLGGGDEAENLIALTAGDHFFAHLLLAKIHGGKQWAAVWAVAGMKNHAYRVRDRLWAIRRRRWVDKIRKNTLGLRTGENNGKSDLIVRTWYSVKTGETVTGNRHQLPFSPNQAKDYLRDQSNSKWTIWFAAGEWYTLGNRHKTHEDARLRFLERTVGNSRRQKGKRTGAKNHNSRPVRCVETNSVYESQGLAAKATGAQQAKISECCNGTRKRAGGYHWQFA